MTSEKWSVFPWDWYSRESLFTLMCDELMIWPHYELTSQLRIATLTYCWEEKEEWLYSFSKSWCRWCVKLVASLQNHDVSKVWVKPSPRLGLQLTPPEAVPKQHQRLWRCGWGWNPKIRTHKGTQDSRSCKINAEGLRRPKRFKEYWRVQGHAGVKCKQLAFE